jgi:hypothetical protein
MTYLPMIFAIFLVGAILCGAFLAATMAPGLLARTRNAFNAGHDRRLEAIRRDPMDYIRAFVNQRRRRILPLQQAVAEVRVDVADAEDRERRALSAFPGGEPSQRRIIVTHIVFVVWVISLVGEALIAFPVVRAVSGGSALFGLMGTLVTLTVPVLASLGMTHVIERRKQWGVPLTSVAITGILVAFVSVVSILTSLAPIRAEIEVQDERRLAQQKYQEYVQDGDETAADYAQQALTDLDTREEQAAAWNSVLIPIAMGTEFAAGFVLPGAIALWRLRLSRTTKTTAQKRLRHTEDKLALRNANEQGVLSTRLQNAGLTQETLQRAAAPIAEPVAVEPPIVVPPAGGRNSARPAGNDVIVTTEVIPLDTPGVDTAAVRRSATRGMGRAAARPAPVHPTPAGGAASEAEPAPVNDPAPDLGFDLS